ncbi:MAG: diguanylate cyclase [Anaerolineales bacterium]|nr:diguanylate cyclase [Anaerolineales bacterium]
MNQQPQKVIESGLYDGEVFILLADYELSRAQRYPTPVTVLYITLNLDEAKPEIVESVKQLFVGILNSSLRVSDIPAHYGNDFLVLMPATDEIGGQAAASRLIARLKGTRNFEDGTLFKFTIHIGISTHPGGQGISAEDLIAEAEQASQEAKKQGPQALAIHFH